MVKFENVSQNYGEFIALKDLSFEIKESSLLALLGPNGAGKSTTMNVMTGLRPPMEGEVYINGVNIFDDPIKAKQYIGYLSEIPPLYPELTICEYLQFVAELKGIAQEEISGAIEHVVNLLSLNDRRDVLLKNLSKGLKQRVGIAQSIIHKPKLLVLDEPTVGLEPAQLIDFRNIIRQLAHETKMTVVISTHIMSEASELCDYVIIINDGQKVFDGTKEELLSSNADQYCYHLVLKKEVPAVQEQLMSLSQIKQVTMIGNGIEIYCENDDTDKILEFVLNQKWGIQSFTSKVSSLEKIFLELTHDTTEGK